MVSSLYSRLSSRHRDHPLTSVRRDVAGSQPNFCQSAKLMLISNQEQLRAFNHVAQKVLTLRKSAGEFLRRIQGGIHLTPELPFRLPDGRKQIGKSHIVRDYQEVQITLRSFCTARHGTKNERNFDP